MLGEVGEEEVKVSKAINCITPPSFTAGNRHIVGMGRREGEGGRGEGRGGGEGEGRREFVYLRRKCPNINL